MADHSVFSPSRLDRIIPCPGSVRLIESLESGKKIKTGQSSSYAERGTYLHHLTEQFSGLDEKDIIWPEDVTDEERNGVLECLDYELLIETSAGGRDALVSRSEYKVDLDDYGLKEVFGTVDRFYYNPATMHLDVIDWKFGSGIPVYAFKNNQLMTYAAGAASGFIVQSITLHVVQPLIDNFSIYDMSMTELFNWVHGTLALAINTTYDVHAPVVPGTKQCRWCEAKNHCSARIQFVNASAVRLFEAQETLRTIPDMNDLLLVLELAPTIEQAVKDIKQYITEELQRGVEVSGKKLVRGRANRKWKDEDKAARWLMVNTDIDEEIFTQKLISPSKAETKRRRLKKDLSFQSLFEQPLGKVTLVDATDPRPAIIAEKDAEKTFDAYRLPDKLDKN